MRCSLDFVSAVSNGFAKVRRGIGHAARPYPVTGLPEGSTLELPGRGETYVTDSGPRDAPAVFLLHSVTTTGQLCWYPVLPILNRDFRVITLDHRWHGRGIESDDFTLADCADDVVAVADQLGVDRFTTAGFSMGGGIAQLAWQRHRDRVDSMVLCSTGPYFSSIDPAQLKSEERLSKVFGVVEKVMPSPSQKKLDDWSTHPALWGIRQFSLTKMSRYGAFGAAMADFDSRPWLSEVDVPTAVVVSTRDTVVEPERQQLLVDGIAGAERFDVDGGHACCVLGADRFIPQFTAAVRSVTKSKVTVG